MRQSGAKLTDLGWWPALEQAVSSYGPDETGLIFEGKEWDASLTFGEWLGAARTVAASLSALQVGLGDRVAIAAQSSPLWPVLQVACSCLGCILVPINVRYGLDELAYVIERSQPKVILSEFQTRGRPTLDTIVEAAQKGTTTRRHDTIFIQVETPTRFDSDDVHPVSDVDRRQLSWPDFLRTGRDHEVAPQVRGDRAVLLQWTSGTTSFPKGALLASGPTLEAMRQFAVRMGIGPTDRVFNPQPFYHCGGSLTSTLFPLVTGATIICPERYSPTEAFRLIRKHHCTARGGQAAMYAMELNHPEFDVEDFASLSKGWVLGSPDLRRLVRSRMGMDHLISAYGLTESSSMVSTNTFTDKLQSRMVSEGRPLEGTEVAVCVEGQMMTHPGHVGELCVRGWNLMLEYFEDEDATREAIDGDRWLHTEDMGYIDEAGEIHFVERMKDMIKPGGENVSAAEVERVIASIPGVARVAVVGMPDDRLGEVPAAFVEVVAGFQLSATDIEVHCRGLIADFKIPRMIQFISAWPMTESGKVQKTVLQQTFTAAGGGLVGRSG